MGSRRTRLPVAAKIALVNAGAALPVNLCSDKPLARLLRSVVSSKPSTHPVRVDKPTLAGEHPKDPNS